MATLALTALGSAAGSALLPSGVSILGATITGAAIGQAVGGVVGALIDNALFGSSGQAVQRTEEGPRLSDLQFLSSTEGAHIPKIYGRARISGQVIWATNLEEETITTTQTSSSQSGGKGSLFSGGGGEQQQETVTQTEYRYYANFAVGLCEGEITRVGRIWADGKELNQSEYTIRIYKGTESQTADSLITSKEGSSVVPAYRGTAYVVFERMPLGRFGNRLPQMTFEVFRSVDGFETLLQAVTMIPGSGEFAYESDTITRNAGNGVTVSENAHSRQGGSDWDVSLDQLEDTLPNIGRVALVVSWFGTDLRCDQCEIKPKVDSASKTTAPDSWLVNGVNRASADVVSTYNSRAAFGGTPSDASVVSAIQDLKARGYEVVFYPFILMDIESGNSLTNPYTGSTPQPTYPWRGRITCDPAPDQYGTPDQTAGCATQVAAFTGTAAAGDFTISGEAVTYGGPAEWSFRRFILHYAKLCVAAGGVDAFFLGSELRGLTTLRESASSFPFVDDLVTLASDVAGIFTAASQTTELTYAADWSEYFGYQPTDGSNDVYFHLDDLWSSSDIDAIAIDNYWPTSDWRDGNSHLDYVAGYRSIYDSSYLKANIAGGEGYDWYYASAGDRSTQNRTDITDGGYGKPWVFRYKDIKNWWENSHYNRPGGVESGSPTSWTAESKPIWFSELGCPAVDKGSNQPNVFYDPKSSESFFPYSSRGVRDDLIQRRHIQAMIEYFDPTHDDYVTDANPVSGVYADRMVDLSNIYVYTWDARPYPAFPHNLGAWSDGTNWPYGHWLTGRVADAPVAQTIETILSDFGFSNYDVSGVSGIMHGYIIDRIMSARSALQPLEIAFFLDSFESGGNIKYTQRGRESSLVTLTPDDLVETEPGAELYQLTRRQETELPGVAKVTFIDGDKNYLSGSAEARRLVVNSERVSEANFPMITAQSQATLIAERILQDQWAAREGSALDLPPSYLAYEPSDIFTLTANSRNFVLRMTRISDSGMKRAVEAKSYEQTIYTVMKASERSQAPEDALVFGPAVGHFMDLPILTGNEIPHAGYVAAYQSPWPGQVAFYRSPESSNFNRVALTASPAVLGVTSATFASGPTGRWDYANTLTVELYNGELESFSELAVLNGANMCAVQNAAGDWEVIQFQTATLVSGTTYDLTNLLRGQGGTEDNMSASLAAGANFIMLDRAVQQVNMGIIEVGLQYNWRYGPANRAIDDDSISSAVHTFEGRGLKPWSPVHVTGEREDNGDITISWVRRTRIGGDPWEVVEVPLSETTEAYEVDILDGNSPSTVVRTIEASSTTATYTAAQQNADFSPAPPASFSLNVYQMSDVYGRGVGRAATISVPTWWDTNFPGATMVLDFQNDRYMLNSSEISASDIITGHTGLIDANGIHIDTEDVHFTDQTWHSSSAGTFLIEASHTHATNIVLLGLNGVHGIETHPDDDRVEHWEGTTLLTAITLADASPPSQNWTSGAKMALTWDSSNRRMCMGGGTVASDANSAGSVGTIYLGSRSGSSKWWDGYIKYIAYYPDYKSAAAIQALTA